MTGVCGFEGTKYGGLRNVWSPIIDCSIKPAKLVYSTPSFVNIENRGITTDRYIQLK